MRIQSAFAVSCLLVAAPIGGQAPGTRLSVTVDISSIVMRGDTASVTYALSNAASSQDSMIVFIVDAPARVRSIVHPQPDSIWMADTVIHETTPAAFWAKFDLLGPSATASGLSFESIGLPGIVTHWVQGHFPLPECCDDGQAPAEDVLVTRSVTGKTVGTDAWPIDRSAQALLARLRGLTQSACTTPLSWITDATLCTQLLNDLDAAETYRATGAYASASASVDHFESLLNGPDPGTFATGVSSSAFWLLKTNAEIVKGTL
jgi:hypothetical protein